MAGALRRFPLAGTVVAVTVAITARLALAYHPIAQALDPTTVQWGASICTAVIASGLTTLGLLPSIQRVAAAVVPPTATLPAQVAAEVAVPGASSQPPRAS